MSKASLYNKFHCHLQLLQTNGMADGLTGDYICPLCLTSYTQQEVNTSEVSEEHAPQKALGGHRIALTCKDCNNGAGSEIDCHFDTLIKKSEFKEQVDGAVQRGRFYDASGRLVQSSLEYENGNCLLKIHKKLNDPKIDIGNLFAPGDTCMFDGVAVKYNPDCATAAALKNAYILLFTRIGYPILADRAYDKLRNFICDPHSYYLAHPLFQIGDYLPIADGIYLFEKPNVKGFMIVYSVTKIKTYRVAAFLPAICTSFAHLASFVRVVTNGGRLKLRMLDNTDDFLTDENKIKALSRWARVRTMTVQEIFE